MATEKFWQQEEGKCDFDDEVDEEITTRDDSSTAWSIKNTCVRNINALPFKSSRVWTFMGKDSQSQTRSWGLIKPRSMVDNKSNLTRLYGMF